MDTYKPRVQPATLHSARPTRIVWHEAHAHALSHPSVGWSFTIAAQSRPRPATRCHTAQAFDPTVLEALYFVLALVDDDHEAKESAELSKRMREAAPPRPAPPHESPPRPAA